MSERFVIIKRICEVSVIDTEEDNVLLFSADFEDNEECASYLAEELEPLVRALNEQDKVLKKHNLNFI